MRRRAVVRIWNPDGSTAELSGNGTRIAAALAAAGERPAGGRDRDREQARPRRSGSGPTWSARSSAPSRSATTRCSTSRASGSTIVPVDVGNPHAVVLRYTLSRDDLLRLGPAIETHPRFPAANERPARRTRAEGRRLRARLGARRGGDGGLRLVGRRGRGCRSRARLVLEPRARGDAGWRACRHDHRWAGEPRRAGRADLRRHTEL